MLSERVLVAFCLRTFESQRHRLRCVRGHLAPSWAEYQSLALPPSLYWLYYLFPPMRLIAKHGRVSRLLLRRPPCPAPAMADVDPHQIDTGGRFL
jgi:hypothetical protein